MNNGDLMNELKEARSELISQVKKELLGPGSEFSVPDDEHEIITDMPEIRYSIGVLFPQNGHYKSDNDDTLRVEEGAVVEEEDMVSTREFDSQVSDTSFNKEYKRATSDAEESTLDEEITLASQNLPSSMGFTFFVKGLCDKFDFSVSFGMYRKTQLEDCVIQFCPEYENYQLPLQVDQYVVYDRNNSLLKLKRPLKRRDVYRIFEISQIEDQYLKDRMFLLCNQFGGNGYKREPYSKDVSVVFLEKDSMVEVLIDNTPIKLTALRRKIADKIYSITVMIVNTNTGLYKGINSVFQPNVSVHATNETNYSFTEYSNMYKTIGSDEEEKSLQLLYRNKKVYGTGHGTSVTWKVDEFGKGYITNDFFPMEEVPQIDFDLDEESGVISKCLSMKYLSDLESDSMENKIAAMRTMTESYHRWILQIEGMCEDENIVRKDLRDKAKEHVNKCLKSYERMDNGLKILSDNNNKNVQIAFQLANRAMFMQRIHLKLQSEDKYPGNEAIQSKLKGLNYFEENDIYSWRPFQLAFLLMSLESVIDETCTDRDVVDLIWFPTGGGKTEAYLGLTAFNIFYRRLQYHNYGGTTVIMRYTLRLLAAQQFIRAATLICACEVIRKEGKKRGEIGYPTYNLGDEPISIGLWIGGEHTPNKNTGRNSAQEKLEKLTDSSAGDLRTRKDKYNKFQVLKCPWCGTKLVKDINPENRKEGGKWGYEMKNGKSFYLACTQEGCKFEGKLPIQIVDEELYKNPPTLLFGTVDKFAMLPWKNEIGSFFATNSENRAPELIIQDELHLISGPLGTMVGLYETVIDALCTAKGVRPKIVASTATIRRAKDQCSVLFNRDVSQFPSPGIDADDSYFAKEADLTRKYGRMYVGLMPSGKTKAMMEVRSIAAILGRTDMLKVSDEVKDKFWTLAVYFNSLKDLGKCSTLIDDDVKDFIKRTAYRFGLGRGRLIGSAAELTSRVSTSELNETLERLERMEYSKKNFENKKYAINTLLATNMISVGVDVARLNVMLLVGQPKLTSEYIQASSRIGRSYPGVAFTLYDGSKSRDRSHYEQFKSYHESFYKYVEPTGATPFSEPARERALHAIAVSFIRHKYGLSLEQDAGNFDKEFFETNLNEIKAYITDRVKSINARSEHPVVDDTKYIEEDLTTFFDEWHRRVGISGNRDFYYGEKFMVKEPTGNDKRLMKPYGTDGKDAATETMTSMRNVDKSAASSILIWEEDV